MVLKVVKMAYLVGFIEVGIEVIFMIFDRKFGFLKLRCGNIRYAVPDNRQSVLKCKLSPVYIMEYAI